MQSKSSLLKKGSKFAHSEDTLEVYSPKLGRNIEVTISPALTEKERLKRIIGLSNSVTTG